MKIIGALEKALLILDKFSFEKPEWSLAELTRELGWSKPTVLRLLNTLEKYGFVNKNSTTKKYHLGLRLFDLGSIVAGQMDVRAIALPVMRKIRDKINEAVYLNVILEKERVCVEFLDCSHTLKASVNIGQRSPLYVGASALVLLAFHEDRERIIRELELKPFTPTTITDVETLFHRLEEIRQAGYAISWGERNMGLVAISAPVFDRHGKIAASLSIGLPEVRAQKEKLELCIKLLQWGGGEISSQLGHQACKLD
ncbi:IclR family transcriptional regulator [Desulfofundulus thermosubterraneus]|uniref:Transcriptional regulator, IclR family n=1 Tax=Desulfofundulus thermosubterraneus DSM 16057 TaxID=1121432 RepID=A0A1M6M860_9FIRM|nr:IclR family transcriptional regulator [Desulfofundulus thermosubterraneus]SHJ79665.1 transcriptional regulator, IclR family [Desulfofundulus thermosubterraneus DSM 16057]